MRKLLFIIPLGISLTAMSCSDASEKAVTSTTDAVVKDAIEELVEPQAENINENVSVDKFAELVAKGDGQVVDVRTPEEWAEGTMKDAIKINFFDTDFSDQLTKLDKEKPVYVYCKSGGRSGQAAVKMQAMGFTHVYNLVGGIGAWDAAGKEKAN